MFVPFHALASGLLVSRNGGTVVDLRVLVQRIDRDGAHVVTDDPSDVGTRHVLPTANLSLLDEQRIRLTTDDEPDVETTWGEWKRDNAEGVSFGDVEADLIGLGKHEAGGGAAPVYVVTLSGGK